MVSRWPVRIRSSRPSRPRGGAGRDLDLDQRRDWLDLFPFLDTRQPSQYAPLVAERSAARQD
jgi:hypothetical protein